MNSKTDHVLMSLPSSGAGSVLVTEETLKKWLKASAESLMARTKGVIENLDSEDWHPESASLCNYKEELESASEILNLVGGLLNTNDRVEIVLQRRDEYQDEV